MRSFSATAKGSHAPLNRRCSSWAVATYAPANCRSRGLARSNRSRARAGIPPIRMSSAGSGFDEFVPRSFAADAHDCIMVRIKRPYRIQVCSTKMCPNGGLPSEPPQTDTHPPNAEAMPKTRLRSRAVPVDGLIRSSQRAYSSSHRPLRRIAQGTSFPNRPSPENRRIPSDRLVEFEIEIGEYHGLVRVPRRVFSAYYRSCLP